MGRFRRCAASLLATAGMSLFPLLTPAQAQDECFVPGDGCDAVMTDPIFGGPFCERSTLTGDLFGAKPTLADHGITYEILGTQFYQGVAAGGRENDWEYGGKFDYIFHFDGQKMGLWQGMFIDLHGESRLGQSVNNIDGLLTASNLAMFFPEPDADVTALTGFKITQALSESFAVYAGKINTLDDYPLRFTPKLGLDRPGIGGFMNTSFVFNPIMVRTIPYSALAVGAAVLNEGAPILSFTVFDPRERATIGLEDPYAEGAVLMPDLNFKTSFFGLPGLYNFGGTYSTASYRSVDPTSYIFIPDVGIVGGEESGSWCVYTNFFQALWTDECDPERMWGIFGQFGISDGNPNPIQYVANCGVAGRSMIPGRPLDTFGGGFFYLGLSDEFKSLLSPILPQQDEYGIEFFYNYAVTPWCRLTTDLQVVRPSTQGIDTAVIPGVRLSVMF